jgi:7,8-dihydro-6-hydroxymethylpterin dimethyltransferase
MARRRPYVYYDVAVSLCSVCYRKVEGKILFCDGQVHLVKRCPAHGTEKVLLSDDVAYYRKCREMFLKTPEQAYENQSPVRYGCPYDCGLCPDHEQHTCVALIELGDVCNLECPVCYAASGPSRTRWRSLAEVELMLDALVRSEREADVLQLSGGEPTLHPEFFAVIDAARARPIRHLMVNTNGIRLAKEPDFAQRLAQYGPGIELYLQFDSFERSALEALRGRDLRETRQRAIANCNQAKLSVTLVSTVQKGLNDGELGRTIEWALEQPAVRGVTFQPVQAAGRLDGHDPKRQRLTLSEVRRKILEQTSVFAPDDILPVPCHPDAIAMAYALKLDGRVVPLTALVPLDLLLEGTDSTIAFGREPALRSHFVELLSAGHSLTSRADTLRDLLCCLPRVAAPAQWSYDNLFRVIIMEFMDAHNFDVRSVKKSCVHIVQPDGRIIPFDTYNLFYRDDLEAQRLAPLRAAVERGADGPEAARRIRLPQAEGAT